MLLYAQVDMNLESIILRMLQCFQVRCPICLVLRSQHIFERKEERRGILDTTREDREYEREKEAAEQTNRSDRGHEHKGQKGQERKKKENKQKKLTPSLKWKTLGLEEEEQK